MDPKQVNVLKLPKRPGFVETPIEHLTRYSPVATLSDVDDDYDADTEIETRRTATNSTRRKRHAGVVILPEAITDNEGKTRQVVTLVRLYIHPLNPY